MIPAHHALTRSAGDPMTSIVDKSIGIQTGGRHSIIPARAYADIRLSPCHIHILGIMAITEGTDHINRRDGWFQVAQGMVALLAGRSRATICRSVNILESAGYLEKKSGQSDNGATAECFYRIPFDQDLPVEFDSWLGAVMPEKQENTGCNCSEQGSETAETLGVTVVNRGVSEIDTPTNSQLQGLKTAETLGVTVVNRGVSTVDTPENMGVHHILESTLIQVDKIELETDTERVVQAFKKRRTECYPNVVGGISKDNKLIDQAKLYLDQGLSVDQIISVLVYQININADRGIEPPAGITRFRNDLDKKRRECVSDYLPLAATHPTRNETPPSPEQSTQTTVVDNQAVWDSVCDHIRDNETEDHSALVPWLSAIRFDGVSGGVATLLARSGLVEKIVQDHCNILRFAISTALGIEPVHIQLKKG